MSFFHKKKNVTKFIGHHYAIWASDSIFYWPKKKIRASLGCGWPSFQALCLGKILVTTLF